LNLPSHGANPYYLYQALGIPMPADPIDFSVNINPFGPPLTLKEKWASWFSLVEDYPDPNGRELTAIISGMENTNPSSIMLGNGADELIYLILDYFSGKHVGIIHPAFSEYEKAAAAYGCEITYIHLLTDNWQLDPELVANKLDSLDVLFLCHPNNPAGITHPTGDIGNLMKACEEKDCYLVIDEAFADFLDEEKSFSGFIGDSNYLIVLKSLTKMYAIAGLRLGFLMANETLVGNLKKMQPHWSVNALALEAGKEVLKDRDYVKRTKQFIHNERKRIFTELEKLGYILSDSKVNFYLLRDPSLDSQSLLLMYLLKNGIVARHTENYPGLEGKWLRFAVRTAQDNNILLEALAAWKQKS
jgi:threonine-phosphate decarboxylase